VIAQLAHTELSTNKVSTNSSSPFSPLQDFQEKDDVVYCRPLLSAGDRVVAINDGMPTWIYEVLVTGPTVQKAIRFVESIDKCIEPLIPIELPGSKAAPRPPPHDIEE